MVPAGYLYKKITPVEEWITPDTPQELRAPQVREVASVSGCIAYHHDVFEPSYFYGDNTMMALCPEQYAEAAREDGLAFDLAGYALYYYTMYEYEFDEETGERTALPPERLPRGVREPDPALLERATLLGFDAAVYQDNVWPVGCSPLSCNYMAAEVSVNEWCLFPSLDAAVACLESKGFLHCEPGPYRIFGVYLLERC